MLSPANNRSMVSYGLPTTHSKEDYDNLSLSSGISNVAMHGSYRENRAEKSEEKDGYEFSSKKVEKFFIKYSGDQIDGGSKTVLEVALDKLREGIEKYNQNSHREVSELNTLLADWFALSEIRKDLISNDDPLRIEVFEKSYDEVVRLLKLASLDLQFDINRCNSEVASRQFITGEIYTCYESETDLRFFKDLQASGFMGLYQYEPECCNLTNLEGRLRSLIQEIDDAFTGSSDKYSKQRKQGGLYHKLSLERHELLKSSFYKKENEETYGNLIKWLREVNLLLANFFCDFSHATDEQRKSHHYSLKELKSLDKLLCGGEYPGKAMGPEGHKGYLIYTEDSCSDVYDPDAHFLFDRDCWRFEQLCPLKAHHILSDAFKYSPDEHLLDREFWRFERLCESIRDWVSISQVCGCCTKGFNNNPQYQLIEALRIEDDAKALKAAQNCLSFSALHQVDSRGNTILHREALNGNLRNCKILLQLKDRQVQRTLDIHKRNFNGKTPLDLAKNDEVSRFFAETSEAEKQKLNSTMCKICDFMSSPRKAGSSLPTFSDLIEGML